MPTSDQPGLIVRQSVPRNLEFRFSALRDWAVPTEQFYVRSHFPNPAVAREGWSLAVGGAVARPLSIGLDEIRAMPSRTVAAVMECAGNGRIFYEPAKEGLQWESGAVGNARWTGVPLGAVLERAGLAQGAAEILLVGADRGVVDGGKKTASPGPIAFARSLPLGKAMSEGVLLAYAMNDEPLTPDHGAPLRAVVAGWYGMAWIKWLAEIRVVERPFFGYWQARDYFRWDRSLGEPVLVPLSELEPKAQIARPVQGARVEVGRPMRIFGAAWSGEAPVRTVEIDTDGSGWRPATLTGPDTPYGWRLWESWWTPPGPGPHTLRCRAVDAAGRIQPDCQQPDRESYLANWILPVEVNAVPAPGPSEPDFTI